MSNEKLATQVARQIFQNIAPHLNQDKQTNFVIMNKINKEGKDHAVILYFVLE